MTRTNPARRRDTRVSLKETGAIIELTREGNNPVRGSLLDLSVAGLALEIDAGAELKASEVLPATVRVGECEVHGSILIKNVRPATDGQVQSGCLFYPGSPAAEYALMALLNGLAGTTRTPVGTGSNGEG